jgi:hypothetical protein
VGFGYGVFSGYGHGHGRRTLDLALKFSTLPTRRSEETIQDDLWKPLAMEFALPTKFNFALALHFGIDFGETLNAGLW